MDAIDQDQLITQVARVVVTQIAPQELSIFSDICEAYFKNPNKMHVGQAGAEETLGFGLESVSTVVMSPIILSIVNNVVQVLAQEVAESGIVKRLLQKLHLVKKEKKKISLPLSPEQIRQVHQLTMVKARQFKLSESQAQLLADSLIGNLALANA
jgi:hypothetical protein